MKSFSFKAIALAFVVAGSAQGMYTNEVISFGDMDTDEVAKAVAQHNRNTKPAKEAEPVKTEANANKGFVDKTCEAIDNICAKVSRPYENLANSVHMKLYQADYDRTAEGVRKVAGFPLNHYVLARTVVALGVTAAIYKTYKYFTKPAADATEGENIEANEANTEVVA